MIDKKLLLILMFSASLNIKALIFVVSDTEYFQGETPEWFRNYNPLNSNQDFCLSFKRLRNFHEYKYDSKEENYKICIEQSNNSHPYFNGIIVHSQKNNTFLKLFYFSGNNHTPWSDRVCYTYTTNKNTTEYIYSNYVEAIAKILIRESWITPFLLKKMLTYDKYFYDRDKYFYNRVYDRVSKKILPYYKYFYDRVSQNKSEQSWKRDISSCFKQEKDATCPLAEVAQSKTINPETAKIFYHFAAKHGANQYNCGENIDCHEIFLDVRKYITGFSELPKPTSTK